MPVMCLRLDTMPLSQNAMKWRAQVRVQAGKSWHGMAANFGLGQTTGSIGLHGLAQALSASAHCTAGASYPRSLT